MVEAVKVDLDLNLNLENKNVFNVTKRGTLKSTVQSVKEREKKNLLILER